MLRLPLRRQELRCRDDDDNVELSPQGRRNNILPIPSARAMGCRRFRRPDTVALVPTAPWILPVVVVSSRAAVPEVGFKSVTVEKYIEMRLVNCLSLCLFVNWSFCFIGINADSDMSRFARKR